MYTISVLLSTTLQADVSLIIDVLELSLCESRTWCTVPAAASVAHDEVTFIAFLAQAAFVSLFRVCVVALLAQSFSVLVPESIRESFDGAEPFCAVLALDAIVTEPGVARD